MADKQAVPSDEVVVRDVIEAWADAVRRKDYDGILRSHAADFVMFDVPPPFKSVGLDAYRKTWDLFFSWSSGPVRFDIQEMDVTAGADVAFAFASMRCEGPGPDGQSEALDFRLTMASRKSRGDG
ncbi:MAG: nuclear transport factor 2 family protein [Roseiarcus sp.]